MTRDKAFPVSEAEAILPRKPGKYAFFASRLDDLPALFRTEAESRLVPDLLYIGKADVSLYVRVWEQECQHLRPGTFFRSVGAMLGYRSPDGGKNYKFAVKDQERIIDWIRTHLLVAWDTERVRGSHQDTEKKLIEDFAPLLNIQNSPNKFAELQRLRAICRASKT